MRSLLAYRITLPALLAIGLVMLQSAASFADVGITYSDAVTGVSFAVPAALYVSAASPGVGGRTTQAIFSTFARNLDPKVTRVDLSRELTITAYVVSRAPGEDLRAFLARNVQGSPYVVADMPRLHGIVAQGLFQSGPRKYALVPRGPDHVLVVDAYPAFSSRIGLFDSVLATLAVK